MMKKKKVKKNDGVSIAGEKEAEFGIKFREDQFEIEGDAFEEDAFEEDAFEEDAFEEDDTRKDLTAAQKQLHCVKKKKHGIGGYGSFGDVGRY